MDEPSVMGTENALMAAALTPGPTTIANAASEPHVQDLARLLVKMGAQIDGIGSNVMTVHGRDKLAGAEHRICPDHIEVASFIALAAATRGELRIRETEPEDLITVLRHFRRLGLQVMIEGNDILVPPKQALEVSDDIGDAIPKIDDGPWPAFPADLTSIAVALATQARGTILIFEKMFENRLFFVDKLVAMGARITLCDPHRAIVSGPSRLHGERVESPDIRAGMAMLIAALCADGTSEIGNVVQIDRGYEKIDDRLRDLGARIERVAMEPPVPA
jgi:UDP-N-acetylglucosamine 1-carboxyvinyltransferase